MFIYNYSNFLFEVKEDKKYFLNLSDKLRKLLKIIKSPIAEAILKSEIDLDKYDISFLDYNEDKDKITFMPVSKYLQNSYWVNNISTEPHYEMWSSRLRQEMSVGKIVNKLFPDKFKQIDIEQFINDFKSEINKSFFKFKLVEGEDIRYWYLDDHYENKSQGDINGSCMKNNKSQPYLDIYTNNPEKCKLLILMSDKEKGKIRGRSIVWWGLRKPLDKIYMDRIYTIHDADKKLYIDYAIQNNWLYKSKQVMHDVSYIDNGKLVFSSVAIVLKSREYKYYPSLDTLPYYTPSTGRLGSNAGNYVSGHKRIILNSANGGHTKMDV